LKHFLDIDGWFDNAGVSTYRHFIEQVPTEGTIVECGAKFGRSSAFLCDEADDSHFVYIIDLWTDSRKKENFYQEFKENMQGRDYTPLMGDATELSTQFKVNSIDLVIIDMVHDYKSVKNDIQVWLPKVKIGGAIIGDDYLQWWPGVMKAVDEVLPDRIIFENRYWTYIKKFSNRKQLI